jgi:hypothetical protein
MGLEKYPDSTVLLWTVGYLEEGWGTHRPPTRTGDTPGNKPQTGHVPTQHNIGRNVPLSHGLLSVSWKLRWTDIYNPATATTSMVFTRTVQVYEEYALILLSVQRREVRHTLCRQPCGSRVLHVQRDLPHGVPRRFCVLTISDQPSRNQRHLQILSFLTASQPRNSHFPPPPLLIQLLIVFF